MARNLTVGNSLIAFGVALVLTLPVIVQGQRGGQGGRGAAPASPQEASPIDLTGYWVSVVTEDWRWRMITPPRGDFTSVPLNVAGQAVANVWDMAQDVKNGNECRPFGAAGLMRVPGRVRITWDDGNTIRLETDAGTQTRLLHFGAPLPTSERTWQGRSVAQWETLNGGRGRGGAPPHGSLKVVTTMMKSGYLRWNGVPYSEDTVLTEYFDRHGAFGQEWFTVTTIVEDSKYLNQPFITTTHFRREPDGSKWSPTPCETTPPPVAKLP